MVQLPRYSIGDRLGTDGGSTPAYEILQLLGAGGAGQVYRAKVLATGETVVIKTPRSWRVLYDVYQEARYLGRESIPHVARLRDVDHASIGGGLDMPFLVMDSYACSLHHRMKAERLIEPSRALRWIADCARGLQASQLVHRDVKPENILLDERGDAWVCDFGLAIPANPVKRQRMGIQINAIIGTMVYMCPEQIYEAADIDIRADIYALGLILYEMLTGRTAQPRFQPGAMSQDEYLLKVCDHEVAWQDIRDPHVADVVRTCTAKCRRERYPDYWALLDAIDDAARAVA